MLREHGTTRLNVVPGPSARHSDPFLRAVREAAEPEFNVLGEIGRGSDGVIIYLAREADSRRLVALRLQREGQLADEFALELVRHLDNAMPAPESLCFKCGKAVKGWARFCSYCGTDLSGAAPKEGAAGDRALLLEAVREAVSNEYEVLGEMSRNEGGGAVYFARELASGRIVALRLQPEGTGDEFSLGVTTAMKPLARSLGVKPVATQVFAPLPAPGTPPPLSPPAPAQPVQKPPPLPAGRPAAPPPPPAAPSLSNRSKLIIGIGALILLGAAGVVFTLPQGEEALAPEPIIAAPDTAQGTREPVSSPPPAPAETVAAAPRAPAPRPAPVAAPPRNATVQVTGLPATVQLRVDGRPTTARRIPLSPGRHILSVSVPGYLPRTDTLRLRAGETIAWSPALTAAPAAAPAAEAARTPAPAPPPAPAGPNCAQTVAGEQWQQAFESCMREALGGSAAAQRRLAQLYERGRGTGRSEASAARWYESAAREGDQEAMYIIGGRYERGRGVAKNQTTALQWYTSAANAGHLQAQIALGAVYERGRLGVTRDRARAIEWYRKAAAQGNEDAAKKVRDLSD